MLRSSGRPISAAPRSTRHEVGLEREQLLRLADAAQGVATDRDQLGAVLGDYLDKPIAQGGLEAVTFRNLAAVIGCSTTAISHYFPTRNDVLLATYSHVADRARRQRQARPADTGIDVAAQLQQILPIGSDKSDDWKVWLCFWTAALFDPRLADLQKTGNAATRDEITQLLRRIMALR